MKKSVFTLVVLTIASTATINLAQANSLQIEQGGQVRSVQLSQKGNELIVSGSVHRGLAAHRFSGAHVDVQLLDSKGRILGTASALLLPGTPRKDVASNYRARYLLRLPASATTQVSTLRVNYIGKPHGECPGSNSEASCSSC